MLDHESHFWMLDQDRERLLEQRALERAARTGRPRPSWFALSRIGHLGDGWRLASAAAARVRSRRAIGRPAPTGPQPF
jgi:hypothetical protein